MSKLFNMRLTEADQVALATLQERWGLTASGVMRRVIQQAAGAKRAAEAKAAEPKAPKVAAQSEAKPFVCRLDKSYAAKGGRMR